MDELPSATPDAPWRAANRIDPIYGGLFTVSSTAVWESVRTMQAKRRNGLVGRVPAMLNADADAAWRVPSTSMWWQRRLDVWGAVTQWCTLTTQQVAAVTGIPIAGVRRCLSELFAMGLVECGLSVHPMLSSRALLDEGAMWRPGRLPKQAARLWLMMTTAERLSVSGGRPVVPAHQFDRHNVSTAEFALRLAEFAQVGTVLGDTLSGVGGLTVLDGRGVALARANMQADMTVVRPDGLRIAVEVTVSCSPDFPRKVRNWAAVLSQHPLAESGLVVMFLLARRLDSRKRAMGATEKQVRRALREAVQEFRGAPGDPTAARMIVARWDDYFPEDGTVDVRRFLALSGHRPTGQPSAGEEAHWERVDVLDARAFPFVPADPFAPLAVIDNSRALRSTPHWLRSGGRPNITDLLLRRAGFHSGVPHLTAPIRGKARAPHASGVAGPARVPDRLLL